MQRTEPRCKGRSPAASGHTVVPQRRRAWGEGCRRPISLLLNKSGPMREEEGKTGDPHPRGTIKAAVAPRDLTGGSMQLLRGEMDSPWHCHHQHPGALRKPVCPQDERPYQFRRAERMAGGGDQPRASARVSGLDQLAFLPASWKEYSREFGIPVLGSSLRLRTETRTPHGGHETLRELVGVQRDPLTPCSGLRKQWMISFWALFLRRWARDGMVLLDLCLR